MTFSRVNGSGSVTLDTQGTSVTVAGLPASAAGSLIVVPFDFIDNVATGINVTAATSNVGGTWVIFQSAANNQIRTGFAYCLASPADVTQVTLTIAGTAGSNFGNAGIEEWSYSGTCTVDQTNSAVGASPLSSGSITNTTATGLMFGTHGAEDTGTGTFTASGSGTWSDVYKQVDTTLHTAGYGAYQVASTTGPHNFTSSYSVETVAGTASIISFQESSGSTPQLEDVLHRPALMALLAH